MQIRLFNETCFKIYADVNGVSYKIPSQEYVIIDYMVGLPVRLTLEQRYKSMVLANPFGLHDAFWDWFRPAMESITGLVLKTTYNLKFSQDKPYEFIIREDIFELDKYTCYERLYIDDTLIKNDCTYEVTRSKKASKRMKFFNVYTLLLVVGVIFLVSELITYNKGEVPVDYWNVFWGFVLSITGFCGKIKIRRKTKKYSDPQFAKKCFDGAVPEYSGKTFIK